MTRRKNRHVPFGRGRICHNAQLAGLVDPKKSHEADGEQGEYHPPRCTGPECSSWERCLYDALAYRREIRELKRQSKPRPKRAGVASSRRNRIKWSCPVCGLTQKTRSPSNTKRLRAGDEFEIYCSSCSAMSEVVIVEVRR